MNSRRRFLKTAAAFLAAGAGAIRLANGAETAPAPASPAASPATPAAPATPPPSPPAPAPAAVNRPVGVPRDTVRWWRPRHKSLTQLLRRGGCNVLFLGDSITYQWASSGLPAWRRAIAPFTALNAGFGGDHSAHVLWHLQNGLLDGPPDIKVIVLLAGTNDNCAPAQTVANIAAALDEIRRRQPLAKTLLLGVLPRGEKPRTFFRNRAAKVNPSLARLADGRRVFYKDIGAVFLAPNGNVRRELMADFVHPTAAGYEVFADALLPELRRLLGR